MTRWIFLSLLLSGCATMTKGPSFAEAKALKQNPGYATLYIFRENAEPTAWGSTIYVRGKQVAALNQAGFTWVYVKPGHVDISAVWSSMSGQKDSSVDIETRAGKAYYVELTGISKAEVLLPMVYFKVGSGMAEVKPEAAVKRLSECCKFKKPATETL